MYPRSGEVTEEEIDKLNNMFLMKQLGPIRRRLNDRGRFFRGAIRRDGMTERKTAFGRIGTEKLCTGQINHMGCLQTHNQIRGNRRFSEGDIGY